MKIRILNTTSTYVPVWVKKAVADLEKAFDVNHVLAQAYNISDIRAQPRSNFIIVELDRIHVINQGLLDDLSAVGWIFHWFQDFKNIDSGDYIVQFKFKKSD